MWITVFTGMFLGVCAIEDLRKKSISNYILILGTIVMVLLVGAECANASLRGILGRLAGVVPGCALLLLAVFLKGKVGAGDGIVLMITGPAIGLERNIAMLLYGLIIAAVMSGILLCLRKVGKNTKIPFIPFLLCGFIMCLVMKG